MESIVIFIMLMFIMVGLGGGLGYLFYIKTRSKGQHWIAKCYQISDGVKPKIKDKDGNIILDIKLNDLKPYVMDKIIKIERKSGTTYRLQTLKINTNAITADMVENWGPERKEVSVLIINDQASAMKQGVVVEKGIDVESTKIIFSPMPRERLDLITSSIIDKKERSRQEKNIWQAISTWIVAGIIMLGLVSVAFLTVDGQVRISELASESQKLASNSQIQASKNYLQATQMIDNSFNLNKTEENRLGKQPK